jgi:hypothetical protein
LSSPKASPSSTYLLNNTDPWTEVDGERSSIKTTHPVLTDTAVRRALGMLVDRKSVQDHIYGRTGIATGNFLNSPEQLPLEQHDVGVQRREGEPNPRRWRLEEGRRRHQGKDGRKLKFVYQTSINTPRQKTQAIVKQACQKAGIDVELKSVTARCTSPPTSPTRHHREVLLRHPDVHDQHDAADPETSCASSPRGSRAEGEQVAGPQRHALAKRGVRPDFPRGAKSNSIRSSARPCSSA